MRSSRLLLQHISGIWKKRGCWPGRFIRKCLRGWNMSLRRSDTSSNPFSTASNCGEESISGILNRRTRLLIGSDPCNSHLCWVRENGLNYPGVRWQCRVVGNGLQVEITRLTTNGLELSLHLYRYSIPIIYRNCSTKGRISVWSRHM